MRKPKTGATKATNKPPPVAPSPHRTTIRLAIISICISLVVASDGAWQWWTVRQDNIRLQGPDLHIEGQVVLTPELPGEDLELRVRLKNSGKSAATYVELGGCFAHLPNEECTLAYFPAKDHWSPGETFSFAMSAGQRINSSAQPCLKPRLFIYALRYRDMLMNLRPLQTYRVTIHNVAPDFCLGPTRPMTVRHVPDATFMKSGAPK
jgi:hypothetical protein